MEETQPVILIIEFDYLKTFHTNMQFLAFAAYQVCVARNERQQLTFPYVFTFSEVFCCFSKK